MEFSRKDRGPGGGRGGGGGRDDFRGGDRGGDRGGGGGGMRSEMKCAHISAAKVPFDMMKDSIQNYQNFLSIYT